MMHDMTSDGLICFSFSIHELQIRFVIDSLSFYFDRKSTKPFRIIVSFPFDSFCFMAIKKEMTFEKNHAYRLV